LKKLYFIKTTLLISIILCISINSSIPISLEQQENIGMQENVTAIVHHISKGVNDSPSFQESTSGIVVQNAVTAQKIQDLENESYLLSALGITFGLLVYLLSKRDLNSVIDRSVEKTVRKMVEVVNAQLRVKDGGKVAIRDEKIIASHPVSIADTLGPLSDSIQVKVTKADDQKIVAQNKTEFTMDAVFVKASDSKSNETNAAKPEKKELKDDLSKGVKL
jgi:hypothetical protein